MVIFEFWEFDLDNHKLPEQYWQYGRYLDLNPTCGLVANMTNDITFVCSIVCAWMNFTYSIWVKEQ